MISPRFAPCPLQVFFYLKLSPSDNEYAHPMDIVTLVDLSLVRFVVSRVSCGR